MSKIIPTEADRKNAWKYAPACYEKTDYNAWMAGVYDKSAPVILDFASHALAAAAAREIPDLEGHTADAVRDALRVVCGEIVSFDESGQIARHIIKHVETIRTLPTTIAGGEQS